MITVRTVKIEDYKFINKWWLGWGEEHSPKLIDLPDRGLGGVVVEKNGKPIAVNYIYLTNSNMAYLANAISDPNYKGRDRLEIGNVLIKECVRIAEAIGCEAVVTTTGNKGLLRRYKAMNWEINDNVSYCTKYIYNAR